ncbi:MAG TPA: cellulase family glycosylhydrolase [Bacillota bacterium]|nr:cellulase family glycosylhydrolase [Bacillota bacterium]
MIKKTFSKVAALTLIAVFLFTYLMPIGVGAESKGKMQEYVESMQPGWNLGNTFDATGAETSWGNPLTTKELIDTIAYQGFKSIRIPVTWGHRMDDEHNINPQFLERVAEVVDWSLDAGMYVMLNMHHDTSWIYNMKTEEEEVLEKFSAAWTQIADYFKDYPDKLMFEGINEPRFDEDWGRDTQEYFDYLYELNMSFYNISRGSGGANDTRPLVLTTITSGHSMERIRKLKETIEELDDDNIIATVHYYGYWPFSVNIGGSTSFDDQARRDIESNIGRVYKMFVEDGIPVVIGEYGLLGFDNDIEGVQGGEVLKYFEYATYYNDLMGITHMLWDNGQHFDRANLTWYNDSLYQIIAQSVNGRSSTAESDMLFIKEGEEIGDRSVNLNLNGNELVGLKLDDRQLSQGEDYSLEEDILVLSKDILTDIRAGDLGVKASLYCQFDSGPDWKVDIIKYNQPLLKDVRRTRDTFMIPTQFNSDRLKTMEAVYVDGGNAGPDDWTSYKEYSYAFSPVYEYNIVKLTEEFFDQVNDDQEILLKFHFWSGEVIDYRITKSGNWIDGVSTQEDPSENGTDLTPPPEDVGEEPDKVDGDEPEGSDTQPDEDKNQLVLAIGIILAVILVAAFIMWLYKKEKKKGCSVRQV